MNASGTVTIPNGTYAAAFDVAFDNDAVSLSLLERNFTVALSGTVLQLRGAALGEDTIAAVCW